MAIAGDNTPGAHSDRQPDVLPGLLRGYRFTVCESPAAAGRALAVRREVYVSGLGYDVPVPDTYDFRSWLLTADDTESGCTVGTLRITPRFAGPLELEEHVALPLTLRSPGSYEINRFAILPAYRKGKTFLPVVSLGLFKLARDVLSRLGAHRVIIASKPERVWTYRWLTFETTGLSGPYESHDGAEHEVLVYDFRTEARRYGDHPFRAFFLDRGEGEVVVPGRMPPLDLVPDEAPLRVAVGA